MQIAYVLFVLAAVIVAQGFTPYPVVNDKDLDCAVRIAAWNYSQAIQPTRGSFLDVFDALELDSYCAVPRPAVPSATPVAPCVKRDGQPCIRDSTPTFYVDALNGNDNGSGNLTAPFATVSRGVDACRAASAGAGCALLLRDAAPFLLSAPLQLTAADSGLTIAAYPGEQPMLTGAVPVLGAWAAVNTTGGANIWATSTVTSRLVTAPLSLFVDGVRMPRARWPNANPETDLLPVGYSNASSWLPSTQNGTATVITAPTVSQPWSHFFPNYTWGTGGTAVGYFEPPEGYWIHPTPAGGATYRVPSGFRYNADAFSPRAATWANASTGTVFAFHGQYWGNWAFEIAAHDASSGTIQFGRGGWQEARGWQTGGALYVEGIAEELDAPGEWHWDADTQMLYVWYNASSGTPPPAGAVSLSQLEQLLTVTGTPDAPAANISLHGLTLTGSQPTYLSRPFRAPSGGDWSFAESAAVYVEGSAGFTVTACNFTRLGGNGILLRGYNRGAYIADSSFRYLGDSAVVACGVTDLADGTAATVPEGTLIQRCVAQQLGLYVKQSGFYYAALTANTTLQGNVAFNLPRAAVNVNDEAYGGHLVTGNLFFNTVCESADHGAANSWGRQPYLWLHNGQPTTLPLPIVFRGNFLINSRYGIHSLDRDDGSSAFIDQGNAVAFAGMKNYLGFNKTTRGNLFIRPDFAGASWTPPPPPPGTPPLPQAFYFPACARSLGQYAWGPQLADAFINNTCILNSSSPYLFGECTAAAPEASGAVPLAAANSFWAPGAQLAIKCGSSTLSLPAAQAVGLDVGSTVSDSGSLSTDDVVAMIHAWLGF